MLDNVNCHIREILKGAVVMKKTRSLNTIYLMNGLVFFSPVALLIRTEAGLSLSQFFILQAILSITIFVFEIPTGKITDIIGYKKTIILSQLMLWIARILLMVAFNEKSIVIFVAEALIEGIASCFSSGTFSAYMYVLFGESDFLNGSAKADNYGTIGFIISTISYAGIYAVSGMNGLLIGTIISSGIGVISSFLLTKEDNNEKQKPPKFDYAKELLNTKVVFIMFILSALSIAFILINFFYVDKLLEINIDEKFMSVIIIGYSLIELLCVKIFEKVKQEKYHGLYKLTMLLLSIFLIIFGYATNKIVVIGIMLFMPLIVDIPNYIISEVQNVYIDEINQEEKRAELLSIFNMGVSLVEIIFLFASSLIVNVRIKTCFLVLGIVMLFLCVTSRYMFNNNK